MTDYNIISFPRSGQHLTEKVLKVICSYFNQPYSYCEFYNCCRTIPCKKKYRFMKNHDFNLNYLINSKNKYIVLYRTDFIHQLESWFRLKYHSIKTFNYRENFMLYNNLLKFIKSNMNYRKSFINKWVHNQTNNKNCISIDYDEIIKSPQDYLKKLLTFMELKHDDRDCSNILSLVGDIKYLNRLPFDLYKKIIVDLNIQQEKVLDNRFLSNKWKLF
jgi:hypothetical protein